MSTPDAIFEELTTGLRRPSPLAAMFAAATDTLVTDRPEGFTPEDVGELAWQSLPEFEKPGGMVELLYTFWAALQDEQDARLRYEAEQGVRTALAERLDDYQARLVLGSEVTPDLVDDIAILARTLLGGAR